MATLVDVARRAGVSVSMASRVLNEAPETRASPETRARIQSAADALGYRANFAARALKGSRTHVIGVVLPDLANSVFTELLDAVEEEAARHGYLVLLARAETLLRDPDAIPRLVLEGRVDGVIIQSGEMLRPEALESLTRGSTPAVFVNSGQPAGAGSVSLDDERGGAVAAEHLLNLGHRELAFVSGMPGSSTAELREAGFRRALAGHGIDLPESRVTRLGYTTEQGIAAVGQLLAAGRAPTAIAVANVNAGYGVLRELRRREITVPDDISVIAIHESRAAANTWPPLTTVEMPLAALGTAAVEALLERVDTGLVHHLVITDPAPRLHVRDSTGPHQDERANV
jgi:LacI family transcriptional regulator